MHPYKPTVRLQTPRDARPRRAAFRPGRVAPRPTATIPPTTPRSGKHRRRMLKDSIRGLAKLTGYPCRVLATATPAQLLAVADGVRPFYGEGNRRGKARRLAAKVVRLTAVA